MEEDWISEGWKEQIRGDRVKEKAQENRKSSKEFSISMR